ncbi:MAG TPA: hypothetical protein VFS61_10095 [Anaerolineales bacterium]|nr:hypothetical protein [Anaerolineales bacterium]
MAWLEGRTIHKFVFWPTVNEWGSLRWGYVELSAPTTWLTTADPYFADLFTFGLISPLFNSGYNYWRGFVAISDVCRLLQILPPFVVHAYLVLTIALYSIGPYVVFRRGPRGSPIWKPEEQSHA